ncbi:methionyl-tRNA formyltransferase [Streptomyces sp. CA-132043]|uniref:methionyl-tRNA formyltransferase n=1 Tax=Streptomyces sp. CA-132043 TaxID=3240048 RepID=UPI003D89FF9F
MSAAIRIVLFSEINSKLGAPFLTVLAGHPQVELVGLVTSPPGRLCSYFTGDADPVDLERQGREAGVPVLRPRRVSSPEAVAALRKMRADYFIVANFQQIFTPELLGLPAEMVVNFHPSPLPRYAGLAPFYWMVRNGERFGAVSAIEMAEGIDTGPVIMQREVPLAGTETALALRTAQEQANVRMLRDLIPELVDRSFIRVPQNPALRTYFSAPQEKDHLIDFREPAAVVQRVVRAGYRHPGAFTLGPDGTRVTILGVAPAGGVHLPPPAAPGTVRRDEHGVFVATADEWLRITSVERDGVEVSPFQAAWERFDNEVLGPPRHQAAPA